MAISNVRVPRGRSKRLRWSGLLASSALVLTITACADDDSDDTGDDALAEELDSALAEVETLEAERDELADELEAVTEAGTEELDQLRDDLDAAETEAEAAVERADEAEALVAEIETVIGQFPISLDSSLIPDDMPGTYQISFEEAYCDGFASCGTVPDDATAEIYFTDEQFLRVEVPGILDAGLFALEGSLYGIVDSETVALAACGDTQRPARITMSLYADGIEVLDDGTRVVKDVTADITVDARSQGEGCPSGLVFYASELVPVE